MSITLKQAARQALETLEEIALAGMSGTGQESEEGMRDWHARQAWKFIGIAARALDPLRTAIQQAESEPVAWGWAIVDNKGLERRTRARIQDFFGSNQEAKPFSLEDVAREDREFAGCAPHHVITLFTHPAPGVPGDVRLDAERYQYLLHHMGLVEAHAQTWKPGKHKPLIQFLQDFIDAAMLAAPAQKGGE